MNPAASAYVRRHPSLSSESMKKWRVGYLPNDSGGDRRGWSLRGGLVYPVFSENGKVLAWTGRDLQFEQKEHEFLRVSPAERAGKDAPAKHRFPKGFHRGLELFGQQSSRLREPGYRRFLDRTTHHSTHSPLHHSPTWGHHVEPDDEGAGREDHAVGQATRVGASGVDVGRVWEKPGTSRLMVDSRRSRKFTLLGARDRQHANHP